MQSEMTKLILLHQRIELEKKWIKLKCCFSTITALVEKIYQAQKERDAAMNARLHMANSEREELIDKLRRAEREHAG